MTNEAMIAAGIKRTDMVVAQTIATVIALICLGGGRSINVMVAFCT